MSEIWNLKLEDGFWRASENPNKFELSVISMVRPFFFDEFEEWIEWHSFVGVDHFFIYDDTDNLALTRAFAGDKRITFCNWVDHAPRKTVLSLIQTERASRIIEAVKPACNWITFIDDDEYIVPANNDLKNILKNLEEKKEKGLEIFLKTFGTDEIKSKPEGLVAENYKYWQKRFLVKSICKPEAMHSCQRINCFFYKDDYQPIYPNGVRRTPNLVLAEQVKKKLKNPPYENIWLHHYATKSEEHLEKKMQRGCITKRCIGQTTGGKPIYESKWKKLIEKSCKSLLTKKGGGKVMFDWEKDTDNLLEKFKLYLSTRKLKFLNLT